MRRRALGVACCMALSIVPAAAVAEEGDTTGLRVWDAPSECILLDELRTGVAVQRTAAFKEVRSVEGKVQTSDSGWSVMLTVYEGALRLGERVLELPGEDCRAHDETLALVIALLLEHGPPPAQESAEIESGPEVAEPKISDLPKAESPPSVGSLVEHPEKKLRAKVGPGVRALGGLAPSLVWGPTFLAGLTYLGHWAIDVQGDFYAPGTDQLLPSGRVTTVGGRVHARACVMPAVGRVRVSACPGVGWILLRASGRELIEPQRVTHRSAEVGAEVGILVRIVEPVSLLLEGGGLIPFRRGRFVLAAPDGFLEVHQTARFFNTASFSLIMAL